MTPTTTLSAVVGDYVPPMFTYGPGHVHERCATTPPLDYRRYCCLSCGLALANAHQLEAHIETRSLQPHVIARACPVHGWETL